MSAGVVNNLDLDLLQTFFHSLANYFGGERLHTQDDNPGDRDDISGSW